MSRQYPRIGSSNFKKKWADNPKGAPKCSACGAPATHSIEVEVNWFRGDDERRKACREHKDDAAALLAGPVAAAPAPVESATQYAQRKAAETTRRALEAQVNDPLVR